MKNVIKKLHEIQKKVRAVSKDEDTKSNYNPNGFKYVSGDKIIGVIRPLMDEHGLILKTEVVEIVNSIQEYTTARGTNKKEVLTSIKMKMTWVCVETGEVMECMWAANGMNDWDKGFGSAVTYGVRYFLLKQFLVSTDEDDVDAIIRPDGMEKSNSKGAPSKENEKSKPWLDEGSDNYQKVVDYISKGGSIDDIYKKYRVNKEVKEKLLQIKSK